MIISSKKRFIFIHIPKTAGTSITASLIKYGDLKFRMAYYFLITRRVIWIINIIFKLSDKGNKWFVGFHKHDTAVDVQSKLGKSAFGSLFKFAFVREPYSYMSSLYHYIQKSRDHKYYKEANRLNFDDFTLFYINRKPKLQYDYVYDEKGVLMVDFIGKLENINDDLRKICLKLNLDFSDLKLQRLNQSKNTKIKKLAIQKQLTLETFNHYYEKDFEAFSYNKITRIDAIHE